MCLAHAPPNFSLWCRTPWAYPLPPFVRVVELLDSLLEIEVVLRAACLPELESLRHHGLHTAATVAVRRRFSCCSTVECHQSTVSVYRRLVQMCLTVSAFLFPSQRIFLGPCGLRGLGTYSI